MRRCIPAIVSLTLALVATGCGAIRASEQRDALRSVRPAEVRPRAPVPATEVRPYSVRIHADADYQAHAAGWRDRILAQVQRANAILGPDLGVRLELLSISPWPRAGTQHTLPAALDELSLADLGADVDWVVGYVGRQHGGGDVDDAGVARVFGKHLILTAPEDEEDVVALAVALDGLSLQERAEAMALHARHVEDVAFLHEWAHSLGAMHECSPSSVMAAQTGPIASGFSPVSLALVRLGLERRDARDGPALAAWRERYRAGLRGIERDVARCIPLERELAEALQIAEEDPGGGSGLLGVHARGQVNEIGTRYRLEARLALAELPTRPVALRVELVRGRPARIGREGTTGSPAADRELDRIIETVRSVPAPDEAFEMLARDMAGARIDVWVPPALLRPHRLRDGY